MRRLTAIVALAALVACSHDTHRRNPVDPALYPTPSLQTAVDDTAGTVTLNWTAYRSESPFAGYRVLRQVADRVTVDTLAHLAAATDTTWVDTIPVPDTAYLYRVEALNDAGYETSTPAVGAGPVRLAAPRIETLTVDAHTASAALRWSRYAGPGFVAYRVRRTVGADRQTLAEIADRDSTTFEDANLRGAVDYAWSVDVLTEAGIELAGPLTSGGIHQVLANWPIDTQARGAATDYVRLSGRTSGVDALLVDPVASFLVTYDAQGQPQSPQRVLANPTGHEESRGTATQRGADGTLFAGTIDQNKQEHRVFRVDPTGRPMTVAATLSFDGSAPAEPAQRRVEGELELRARTGTFSGSTTDFSLFDSVRVESDGVPVIEEDFSFVQEDWQGGDVNLERWHFQARFRLVEGWLWLRTLPDSESPGVASVSFEAGEQIGVDVATTAVLPTSIVLGGGSGTRATLRVNDVPQLQVAGQGRQATLIWEAASENGADARRDSVGANYPFTTDTILRLRLTMEDGVPGAEVRAVETWVRGSHQDPMHWTSIAAVGDHFAFTAGPLAFSFDDQGEWRPLTPFSSDVSETRVWLRPGETRPRVGVCLPLEDRLLTGVAFSSELWNSGVRNDIGPRLPGGGNVPLFHPLSFDVGPDGRMYILDAGNTRVVVLDEDGTYLTEFGEAGSAEGQFDFGSGLRISGGLDYAGAIAVDDDGFIYVADIGNNRIQKFAP